MQISNSTQLNSHIVNGKEESEAETDIKIQKDITLTSYKTRIIYEF